MRAPTVAPMRGGTKTLFLTVSFFGWVSAKIVKAKMQVPRASAKQAVANPSVLEGRVLHDDQVVVYLQHESNIVYTTWCINFNTDGLLKILTKRLGRSNTRSASPNNTIDIFKCANLVCIQEEIRGRRHDRTHQLCHEIGQYLAPSKQGRWSKPCKTYGNGWIQVCSRNGASSANGKCHGNNPDGCNLKESN